MKLIRRLVTLGCVTAVLATGCVLYLFNSDPVTIDLVLLQIPDTSIAVVLITTFFVGVVTGSSLMLIASILPKQRKSVDA